MLRCIGLFVTLFFWNFSIFCAVWQTSKACKSDKKGFLLWKIHKYLAQKPVNKNCVFDADWKSDKKVVAKYLLSFSLKGMIYFGKNIPIFRCDRVQRDLTRWLMRKIFWEKNGSVLAQDITWLSFLKERNMAHICDKKWFTEWYGFLPV